VGLANPQAASCCCREKIKKFLRTTCSLANDFLVGRPGFEPGLSASKADDLPLVDRPKRVCHLDRSRAASSPCAVERSLYLPLVRSAIWPCVPPAKSSNSFLQKHVAPVKIAGQSLGENRPRAGLLHTLLSGASVRYRLVQSEQRRTRSGQTCTQRSAARFASH
jgi:hypothetical protein